MANGLKQCGCPVELKQKETLILVRCSLVHSVGSGSELLNIKTEAIAFLRDATTTRWQQFTLICLNSLFSTEKHYQAAQLNPPLGLVCLNIGSGNQKVQQYLCVLNNTVCVTGPSYLMMLEWKTMGKWGSTQHQYAAADPAGSAESQKHLSISNVCAAVGWLELLWNHSPGV